MTIKFIEKEQLRESYNTDRAIKTTCYWFDVSDFLHFKNGDYAIQEYNGRFSLINWNREDIGNASPLYENLKKLTDALKYGYYAIEHSLMMERQTIALRREGKTAAEIKAATGLSYYRQRQIYESHNIPAPSRYGANRRRILELLAAGVMNQSEIARTLGVSRQLVYKVNKLELKKDVDRK